MRKAITTAGLLGLALLPIAGAVSPEAAPSSQAPPRVPVAIAQPLAAMETGPLVAMPATARTRARLPESAMLVLVGTTLLGLGAVVRRTGKN
jgi:hypothetical protein